MREMGVWPNLTGARIVVGFSGGPDSTCLVHVLTKLQARFGLYLCCVYVDHGIRNVDEIRSEIQFVSDETNPLPLPLLVEHIQSGAIEQRCREKRRSVEDEARRQRYAIFRSVSLRLNATYIAVGHTLDDHVETMIMRVFEGADVGGLCGIPMKRGMIIRPLRLCWRDEILEYLRENGTTYRSDSTNLERRYRRNAVRLQLIPAIEAVFPGFRRGLVSLSQKMRLTQDHLESAVARSRVWRRRRGGFEIHARRFLSLPGVLRIQTLLRLCTLLKIEKRLPYRFLASVLNDRILRDAVVLLKGHGVLLRRRGENLFLSRDVVSNGKMGYVISVAEGRSYRIEGAGLRFGLLGAEDCSTLASAASARLSRSQLRGPLVVRSRRAGDSISSREGSKSLKKLYNEWKVPGNVRWKIPVLADRRGVVGVFAQVFGFRDRLRPDATVRDAQDNAAAVHVCVFRAGETQGE